jgi:hypothetical protein
MTLGQKAIQQAVQQSIQQQAQATVLRMLDEHCDIQLISRITHLSPEAIKRLARKNVIRNHYIRGLAPVSRNE